MQVSHMYSSIAAKSLWQVSTDSQNPVLEVAMKATASEKKKGEEEGCSKYLRFNI